MEATDSACSRNLIILGSLWPKALREATISIDNHFMKNSFDLVCLICLHQLTL
jgi:hypothetical protein